MFISIISLYYAITVLSGNINTRVVFKQTRSLVASIQLVHCVANDQGFLIMETHTPVDNEIMSLGE